MVFGAKNMVAERLKFQGPPVYEYPAWAEGLGWVMTSSSMLMIPLWMLITILRQPGSLKQVSTNKSLIKRNTNLYFKK